ncbi:MAG: response regulator [Chloroflexi bacterium]|nr:response regulator [Chloroflexota bacterium]MDK1045491.1 adenylate/guanylate cyclase domain-containing protein [Anaerolineales bacterium]MCH8878100.1 response regulator [Chloroflexota bacterium]MCI0772724.1 response regulator [Chloroflexota bacterium]MCI0806136.1 response regulator [Chloroflexota bacterium]
MPKTKDAPVLKASAEFTSLREKSRDLAKGASGSKTSIDPKMDLSSLFGRKPRILVADDDWLNRDLLQAYLTASGCEVLTASNGEEALTQALSYSPDLALIDVQMPKMDGLELCRRLKATAATRFMPVVIITALDSEDEKLNAFEVGADDFITKPYSSIVLLARVRSLLRIKRLHDEVESRNELLREVLDRYVAEDVADVILTDPERYLKLYGETRPVTVLFADIRNFVSYTEQHTGPEVVRTLNHVFEGLSRVIFAHKGTFDKYLGDGLMAFYGAPVAGDDDAQRAVATAVEMQQLFEQMREDPDIDLKGLGLGVGLHSGEAIVGNIGSSRVMDYTVVGDVVNVAKRLHDRAKPGQILFTSETYKELNGVKAKKLRSLKLPGRQKQITPYVISVKDL